MLRSLWARDFLSLRDVRVELEKLNVLVGLNASGKSNVVRVLELLTAHARGVPVLEGYEEAWHLIFGLNRAGRAEVGVEAELAGGRRAGFTVGSPPGATRRRPGWRASCCFTMTAPS
jgi:energy-coupling factor transporter ATP-binding protein EcfA2